MVARNGVGPRAAVFAAMLSGCAWKLGPHRVTHGAATDVAMVRPSTDGDRWYVPVDSDTLGPMVWFVDTGYSYTTCDDSLVSGLALRTRGKVRSRGELGAVVNTKAQLPPLELGGHQVEGLVCMVRDLGRTSSISDPAEVPVAGVLGIDVLRRFRVVFDAELGVVRLLDPDGVEPLPRKGDAVVRMRRQNLFGMRVVVPVEVAGEMARPLLDTGASRTYVDGARLDLDPSFVVEGVEVRGSGAQNSSLRTLTYFKLDHVTLAGQLTGPVTLIDRDRGAFTPGLLGLDILGQYSIELDFGRRRARLALTPFAELPLWSEWYGRSGRLPAGRLLDAEDSDEDPRGR